MSKIISVANLGKSYYLHHQALRQAGGYRRLSEEMLGLITAPFKRLTSRRFRKITNSPDTPGTSEQFWALRGVTFEVGAGEVVGIIGRNGAGKSTLLKILSRITEPAEGKVTIRGRVASLLEVGTGFHPELTGRENIFLNGAVLGMRREETRRAFDEIVAFAEVEKFLDTPVKRYSSGMYVRLAFAVAAHLSAEILVVDEVLAVGDAAFQKKCMQKMREIASGGRTILFVTHQMAAIENLCDTGILLESGNVHYVGTISSAIKRYLANSSRLSEHRLEARRDRQGNGVARFVDIGHKDMSGRSVTAFTCGAPATLELRLDADIKSLPGTLRIDIGVDNELGHRVLFLSSSLVETEPLLLKPGMNLVNIRIAKLALGPGRYGLTLFAMVNGDVADWVKDAGSFEVEAGDFYGTGQLPAYHQGYMLMEHEVSLQ